MPLDLALTNLNQRIGRYNFAATPTSDIAFDTTQAYAVMMAIACIRGAYWADRNFGSDIGALKKLTSRTPSQATATALDALAQLEQANLIATGSQATASRIGNTNGLEVDVTWNVPGQAQQNKKVQI